MNKRTITKAIEEAKRFIYAAKDVQDELASSGHYIVGTKKSGTLRRASLDLTRALADMRRPS